PPPAPATAPTPEAPAAPEAAPVPPVPPVPSSRHSGDIVRFGGSVTVSRDEAVSGDVVVIGGNAHVNGTVSGNVTVVGGTADIGSTATIHGDVAVVGGTLDRDPDATIDGKVSTIGFDQSFFRGRPWRHGWFWGPAMGFFPFLGFLSTTIRTALLILLVCLVLLIVPRPVETVAARVAAEPVKAGLIGLACELLFVPVLIITIVLLVVTIVGIPLLVLVPFALIALLLVGLLGYTAVASQVGRFIGARFGWNLAGPYAPAIVGVVAINALVILGRLLESLGGFFFPFGLFVLLGGLIEWAAWTTGFGAAVLARFGHRLEPFGFAPAPAPAGDAGEAGGAPPPELPGA
ncbi:MAG: polymer-forming cytoskeletal protein, partial [Acidobacteriota bacterium]|nr:polymer-forming cytoskeletal protein [Acidobacteriota bacterium]